MDRPLVEEGIEGRLVDVAAACQAEGRPQGEPGGRAPRAMALGLVALLGLMLGTESRADWRDPARWHAGVLAGYSFAFELADDTSEVDEVEFFGVFPHVGFSLLPDVGRGRWYTGHLELLVEASLLVQTQPRNGAGGGVGLVWRYEFEGLPRAQPFFELGTGLLGIDLDVVGRSDGFNFSLHGGPGVHLPLTANTELTLQWRYHHISNGGIELRNVAVDSALFLIGLRWD